MRDPESELKKLDGLNLGKYKLLLKNLYRPKSREKEVRYFELYLIDKDNVSYDPIVKGLFSLGRKNLNIKPYYDIDFDYKPRFKGYEIDLRIEALDIHLFNILSNLLEVGSKFIVSVALINKPKLHEETYVNLERGVPPIATYLGYLLYRCKFGDNYKLWMIREGGREGSPALQGERLKEFNKKMIEELYLFLKSPVIGDTYDMEARERAKEVLKELTPFL